MPVHMHLDPEGVGDPYFHDHEDIECSHHWQACPVHTPAEGLPSPVIATTCIYGGAELKSGGSWNTETSKDVWHRVADRLEEGLS